MRPLALLLAAPFLLLPLSAQTTARKAKPHAAEAAPEKSTALPVTRVSLYKNGVGFFEHTGHVTGNAGVTIDFTTAQLNDVLQSLTAIDLNGGRISGAGYNSTTPLDQQLRSLPLALGEDPTAADFYAAIRGARVEVHGPGGSITGRLLSMEIRNAPAAPSDSDAKPNPGPERHYITVVSDSGEVRTLEFTPATSVRLLDATLHGDVTRYLQLLAGNHAQGLRHLTLDDRGTGTRELRVSYISEVPIWKSTYRILFTDNKAGRASANADGPSANTGGPSTNTGGSSTSAGGPSFAPLAKGGVGSAADATQTATLQGWAVVDNTVGTDWVNVQLSLIAGSPQSFIQPLSDPIYSRRPEIPIAQEAQLTPQTHDSGMDAKDEVAADKSTQMNRLDRFAKLASPKVARGYSAGVPGASYGEAGNGVTTVNASPVPQPAMIAPAPPPPPTYEEAATASLTPQSTTAAFDDFFEYKLSEPITIRKNESALVPILQSKLTADRVTLVTSDGSNVNAQPLRALWITNTTGLTLDRGSFSIVENGTFGGEGLLDPIHAGERRLLSYAADQAVHVTTEGQKNNSRLLQISASKGVLKIKRGEVKELTYVIHNAAPEARTVVLEQPIERGLILDSDPKPEETTATVYRWRVRAPAGDTVRLHVGGKREGTTTYYLTQSDEDQLATILSSTDHNPALERALQPVLEARRQVSDVIASLQQTSMRLNELRSEEERQRSNITALNNADKSSRDRFVRDLNTTEDAIKAAQAELASRNAALASARADLANRIAQLQIDETL